MNRKPTIRKSKDGTKPVAPIVTAEAPVKAIESKPEAPQVVAYPRRDAPKAQPICRTNLKTYKILPKLDLT